MKTTYPSSLTDAEWSCLQRFLPPRSPQARLRRHCLRTIFDALFYLLRTGCPWRYLPSNFPPWQTVYYHFRQWRRHGTWLQIQARLRELARLHAGRDPTPSAAIIDSQSVKTLYGGVRGFDGAKKLAGRKRHILVDTQGWLLSVGVHAADLQDRQGGRLVLAAAGEHFPRLLRIWADQGYTGELQRWATQRYGITVEVVYPPTRQLKRYAPELLGEGESVGGFQVVPAAGWSSAPFPGWGGSDGCPRIMNAWLTRQRPGSIWQAFGSSSPAWHEARPQAFSNSF